MRKALAIGAALSAAAVFAAPAAAGFKTANPPYLFTEPTAPAGTVIEPILSTGDVIPNSPHPFGYQMSGIPDGLGSYRTARWGWDWDSHSRMGHGRTFNVVMNHELGRNFPNNPPGVDTRISQLTINRSDLSVEFAEYLFKGNEGYERFCSATLMLIQGRPLYFTGEEAIHMPPQLPVHDGSSIVMDPVTGMWRETEHFGHLQHENVLPLKLRKWVFLTTDDDFRAGQPAYLYAYLSDSFLGGISGREGSLYVWKADDPAETGNATATKGESIAGTFVPIPQTENLSSAQLKAAATARDYLAFVQMILNGDAPDNDDIRNPDNMDASERVLVIQEDRESAFRGDVGGSTGFNRVLVYDFRSGQLTSVARVATPATLRPGTWESSGVDDARHTIGRDWWILDVQAHSTTAPQPGPDLRPNSSAGEDGQLLAIKIPGSQGFGLGGWADEDDDGDDE